MPAREEYIAHNRTVDEIGAAIGADWMIYQKLDDLVTACLGAAEREVTFDCSCFDGVYVTGTIDEEYLNSLESRRKDEAKDVEPVLS
mgnify:FL=1